MRLVDDEQVEVVFGQPHVERCHHHICAQPGSLAKHLLDGLPQRLLRDHEADADVGERLPAALDEELGELGITVKVFSRTALRNVHEQLDHVNGNDSLGRSQVALNDDLARSVALEILEAPLKDVLDGNRLVSAECFERRQFEKIAVLNFRDAASEDAVEAPLLENFAERSLSPAPRPGE